MKILWISFFMLSIEFVIASPIRMSYVDETDIRAEFLNVYYSKQDRRFDVRSSTPAYTDLQEYNPVIFSSGSVNKFLIRIGTSVYKIDFSSN